ncbi:unnamed protein product [Boreogadus saida]
MMEKSMAPHEGDSPIVESLKSAVLEDLLGQYSDQHHRGGRLVKYPEQQEQSLAPKKGLELNIQPPSKKTALKYLFGNP